MANIDMIGNRWWQVLHDLGESITMICDLIVTFNIQLKVDDI